MTGSEEAQTKGLRPSFTPMGMWAFSIGTSIGWGSFIVTCNTYLLKSGILGTVLGLLIGMAVIFVITWNLQYMIRKSPGAGGIYAFEKQVGSKDLGFLLFWFILLTYMAILWANITSVPLFCRFFLGDTFQFGFHYNIFGYEVWFGEALLSICAVVLIGLLCMSSSKLPNKIMIVAALIFGAGFMICALIALIGHGDAYSYSPLYAEEGASAFGQIVRIAAISPWAFIGFENIAHFSEEYTFPAKRVRSILIWSVCLTTGLYILVSLLSISAYPPEYSSWIEYIRDMGNLSGIKAVPAFYAAQHYLGQAGVVVLMLALSMEEPYIYHEDVLDAEGNSRQLQTTKLKYTDDEGKTCILGMCQDVTDLVHVQRENALTKEAYEKAKRIGVIYTHIAETLASGYADMYYVNLETGEFSEYLTDPVKGMLKEERHGVDFFAECKADAEVYVHPRPVGL